MLEKIEDAIKRFIYKRYNISFSKSGEDMQLKQMLKVDRKGLYVDIGCWDPVKASNSYYFHLRGWKGICIDPNPMMKQRFAQKRASDIFVNKAVGLGNESLVYYMLEESSMNTLDYSFIEAKKLTDRIIDKIDIQTVSLKSILDEHLSANEKIDFFDIDVEGFDLEVLESNDWDKYRPKVIVIESNNAIHADVTSEITLFLNAKNYELVGKSIIRGNLGNLFFVEKKS